MNSRYYDSELGRFINADDISILEESKEFINGLNLYSYCLNDPVNEVDENGYFIFSALIVGLIIGSAVGIVAGGKIAYDIAKANGSSGWELFGWTLLGALGGGIVGGVLGAGIGYMAGVAFPAINAFLGSSLTFGFGGGSLALASGGSMALAGSITISVGNIIAIGGSIIGSLLTGIIMFAKGNGPRMGHNQHENQMWKEAMKRLGINNKDLIRRLHNEIHKYGYNETLKDLIKTLQEILTKWGKL